MRTLTLISSLGVIAQSLEAKIKGKTISSGVISAGFIDSD
jgi:hypothetical protein